MTDISTVPNPVIDTDEQAQLRKVAFDLGSRYGLEYMREKSDAGETTDTDTVAENIINGCAGRKASVVLQHDIKDYSVNAVEQVLIWGINNGYVFRDLDASSPNAHHGINN